VTADDSFWRRPTGEPISERGDEPGDRADTAPLGGQPAPAAYSGPPPTLRPGPADLPPPLIQQLAPPRPLPAQDHAALDEAERQGQLVSIGVGVAFAVLVVLLVLFIAIRQLG
jgi:hypothetical protein